MKKYLCILLLSFISYAAKSQIGIKAGGNLTNISGNSFKSDFTLSYHLGVFAELGLSKSWGLQPEILWSETKSRTASTSTITGTTETAIKQGNIKLDYLSIPLLIYFRPISILQFNVGPQFSILTNPHHTLLENGQDAFRSGDLAMVGGLQLNLMNLRIYTRYIQGVTDMEKNGVSDSKNRQIQIGIGLKF